jgi:hypothetical protein
MRFFGGEDSYAHFPSEMKYRELKLWKVGEWGSFEKTLFVTK